MAIMKTYPEDKSGQLFDKIIADKQLKNDAELCRIIDIPPPVLSRIRAGKQNVSSSMILSVHEVLGYSVKEIRALLAEKPITY